MYLRVGSKGDLVRKLQSTLKEYGFDPGHIDGMFGDKTRKAVVELQESMKLEADGVVGHITMEALNIKAKHPALDMGRITRIREILNKRGLRGKVTEAQLLDVLHTMLPKPRLGAPAHADDSHDFATELVTLRPKQREILGLARSARPVRRQPPLRIPRPDQPFRVEGKVALRVAKNATGPEVLGSIVDAIPSTRHLPSTFEPHLRVRVHAVACRNNDDKLSDGSEGQSKQELGEAIARTIAAANEIFDGTGIELIFYPSADLEIVPDTELNQDFIIPPSEQPKLKQSPPLTWAELGELATKYTTNDHRNKFARKYSGKLVLLFAEGTKFDWWIPGQDNWRWCKKCQGLFFAGNNLGTCPEGGQHDMSGSGNYALAHDVSVAPLGQDNWRWCKKCQGLFFAGNNLGTCPEGGQHDMSGSGDYTLKVLGSPLGQDNWRWCKKCQGLFFAGNNLGTCPKGGQHDMSGSGNYTLVHDEPAQWLVSSPRGGGFSWEDLEFVKLFARVGNSDVSAERHAPDLTHEVGHYFHLWHPFYYIKLKPEEANLTDQQKVDVLRQRVREVLEGELAKGTSKEQVVQVLNADLEVVSDTPPDDGGQLLYYMNRVANGGTGCGVIGEVKLNLKDGTPVAYTPDRSLVMSYFKGCLNFDQRFSRDQAERMRNALINGNRRHLVAVQLGETAWPDEIVCATWNPNTDTQFYCWDLRSEDFQKKFDELHAEGMRLCSQQAYTRNGETRYGGIWNPGTQDEVVIWGWEVEHFKDKTVELHGQNMRLIHMESYLLPDGQVRVNAIWNTGTHVQYWVQGWTKDDFTAKCSGMYSKGFRLVLLNGWNLPDGAVRYDAIWNLGSHGQHYIIDWTAEDFQNKYGEMWEQGFKLLVLDTHISDGGIRYDAVWDPDPAPQFVVWGKTREQVRAYYDEMWQQGMKLTSMSALRL